MVGGLELAGRDIEPALRERIIDGLRANASGLKQLLDESLDAAAIDAGAVRIEPRELRVACVMRQVRDEAATLATAKHLTLEVDIAAAGPLRVWADPVRLAQALRNLVFNALKFTPQGRVRVSAGLRREEAGSLVSIEVADSGPGLAPEEIEMLFRPFAQLSDRDALAGSGLGLAISRELVQRMGGRLSVRSAPGQGSLFIIELPAMALLDADAPRADGSPRLAVA
jgi:signal transduction histidine kinase